MQVVSTTPVRPHPRPDVYAPGVALQDITHTTMDLSESDEDLPSASNVYGTPFSSAALPQTPEMHPNFTPGYTPLSHQQPRRRQNSEHHGEEIDIRSMLQQQQGMLQQIITKQESFEEKHELLEAKLAKVEQTVSSQTPSQSDSCSSTLGKRKRVVNRGLSVSLMVTNDVLIVISYYF